MRIDFREISPAGLDVESTEEVTWLESDERDPLRELYSFPTPFHIKVHLDKGQSNVFVTGEFSGEVEARCVRCLKPLRLPIVEQFRLTLMPRTAQDAPGAQGEREIEADDLDLAYYDEEVLDLQRLVSEQVLLLLDLYPHCRADCKGLCPECGIDRNEASCDCANNRVDARFAALQKLKTRDNG